MSPNGQIKSPAHALMQESLAKWASDILKLHSKWRFLRAKKMQERMAVGWTVKSVSQVATLHSHRSDWGFPKFTACRNTYVLPSHKILSMWLMRSVYLRVSHTVSWPSEPNSFLFSRYCYIPLGTGAWPGLCQAPCFLLIGIPCFVLWPRLCSWFQSCPEVCGKVEGNGTLICCAVSKFQSMALIVLITDKVFSQLGFEVDKNWAHQYSSLLYVHAQVSSKTNLALISLGQWNESRFICASLPDKGI